MSDYDVASSGMYDMIISIPKRAGKSSVS
jgi:hypothetical protein